MRTRVLPREEWHRLGETEMFQFLPYSRPEDVEIVVVEDGEQIVARVAVVRAVFLEGFRVASSHRGNAGLWRGLMAMLRNTAKRWNEHWAFGVVDTAEMKDILERVDGRKLEAAAVYVLPVPERSARCA